MPILPRLRKTNVSIVVLSARCSLLCLFLSANDARGQQDEYRCDFRGRNFDNASLAPLSPGTIRLMRPGSDGLEMRLPAGRMLPTVGISPVFRVRGDFEITASFEIRNQRSPQAGYGCGPTIYLATHSKSETSAMLGRLSRSDKKQVYSTNISSMVDASRQHQVRLFDTDVRRGKLRLVRVGPDLRFLVADGKDGPFRQLREAEFTPDDIQLVRLAAQQSDAATPVDVVWHEVVIRADELLDRPETLTAGERRHNPTYAPAPKPERLSWWWSLASGLALILLVGTVVWYRRTH